MTNDELLFTSATHLLALLLRIEIAQLMEEFPVMLGPVLPTPAFRHDHQGHDIEGVHVQHLDPLWGTDWVNLLGLPAVAVPAVIERELGGYRQPPLD